MLLHGGLLTIDLNLGPLLRPLRGEQAGDRGGAPGPRAHHRHRPPDDDRGAAVRSTGIATILGCDQYRISAMVRQLDNYPMLSAIRLTRPAYRASIRPRLRPFPMYRDERQGDAPECPRAVHSCFCHAAIAVVRIRVLGGKVCKAAGPSRECCPIQGRGSSSDGMKFEGCCEVRSYGSTTDLKTAGFTTRIQQTLTSQTARTSMAYNLLATYLRLNAILADFSEP